MKKLSILFILAAGPALAADGPFLSLANTDFIVLLSFIAFIAVLLYFGVPKLLGRMLDDRAAGIQSELDEARTLREEARELLAGYERKQAEVQAQADRIVENAKAEAEAAAEQAKADIAASIERRLAAAQDQIASAEAGAVKEVRDQAVTVAIGAAQDIINKQMTAASAGGLIDSAIDEVATKLN